MRIIKTWQNEGKELINKIINRSQIQMEEVEKTVAKILKDVYKDKDKALFHYTQQYDEFAINSSNIRVMQKEIDIAYQGADKKKIEALSLAVERITNFHQRQKQESWSYEEADEIILGQILSPLEIVGIYVPGGKAVYPSSVLMNALPAKVAGVKKIVMCTPTPAGRVNPYLLIAADLAKVDEIYKVGGAQAVGAMAYGTDSVPRVDKIVGPGNIYVATAKKMVFGQVDIDMIAGPSEILVIADETAKANFVAADLISQAEHDELASSVLLTTSERLAEDVQTELGLQIKSLSRSSIILKSLNTHGAIIIVEDLKEAAEIANKIAPEHLELAVEKPFELLKFIKNAGAVFLGHYTPEPIGDYMAGPNHVLPTGGTARFSSPLSVDDFVKKTSLISYSREGLEKMGEAAVEIAKLEGLEAHAKAILIRLENGREEY